MPRNYRTTPTSRERNRVHAQRTRQRKKEQMMTLQKRATELKDEQIRLKQLINEKSTAAILVHLFAEGSSDSSKLDDPEVEALMKRSRDDIPDASQIPELPALILPGQHASKKMKASAKMQGQHELPNDGIDYELLGRDRSQCTPEELDKIRRERNRMHAKRTRDRKRLFTEKMAEICRQLEDENVVLNRHLQKLDPAHQFVIPERTTIKRTHDRTVVVVKRSPPSPTRADPQPAEPTTTTTTTIQFDQKISALLQAATVHEVSDNSSAGDEESVSRLPTQSVRESAPTERESAPLPESERKHGFHLGPPVAIRSDSAVTRQFTTTDTQSSSISWLHMPQKRSPLEHLAEAVLSSRPVKKVKLEEQDDNL